MTRVLLRALPVTFILWMAWLAIQQKKPAIILRNVEKVYENAAGKFRAGETILNQGEAVDHFFIITDGEVEIIVTNDQSKEIRLARLGHGQFFGEVELTQGGYSAARSWLSSPRNYSMS